jgi:molybdopterin-containing oxidoreductase family iron-sulfur binding subunit
MVVEAGKCIQKKGCSACTDACHLTHNVPDIKNPKEEVKWIWKEPYENVFPDQIHKYTETALKGQPVPVLCNHCERPPCVRVCPTQATFKRDDGIVIMDMHRCIGCRYCIAACPYGSRSFNFKDPRPYIKSVNRDFPTRTKGVVEKCNFCAERLAKSLSPVCVEACQKIGVGALTFGDLGKKDPNLMRILQNRHSIRRRPGLGTEPKIFYIV